MLRLLILFHFFKFSVSSFDFSNLCFSTAVLQKLLPTQAKVSPSIWQSSRKGKLNSVCAVLTAPITPLRSQHTAAQTQPAKQIFNVSHIPYKRCSFADEAPTHDCTMHSWQPCHCAFCSITEPGQGNLVWNMYKFSMESASLQALSAASPPILCLGFFVGGGYWLFPISPGFVLLYIIRIKATSAQLGPSEAINPYFF